MKKSSVILLMILASCTSKSIDNKKSKSEIIQAEKDFASMAKEKVKAAGVFKGKDAIRNFYNNQKGGELQWPHDFADASGNLGYTYGKFIYSEKDSTGKVNEIKGYFHTVWKKQKDGSWKFVWD